MSTPEQVAFKVFRRFNRPTLRALTGVSARLDSRWCEHFPTDSLPDKVARALAERRAIAVKELFESFEFFARVRRRLRAAQLVDVCCGHGLTGMLFALFERRVETVRLIDTRKPQSHDVIRDALCEVAPWVGDKVTFEERSIQSAARTLRGPHSIVAVHACGVRSDHVLDLACSHSSPVAIMPCCYTRTAARAPAALRGALGAQLTTDVDRTYRLEGRGYRVAWSWIPPEITPMNRILVGLPSDTGRHQTIRSRTVQRRSTPKTRSG